MTHSLLQAIAAVCQRRAKDIAEGGEKAARWALSPSDLRPYLYRSVQNEVREQKEKRAREWEKSEERRACELRRRLHDPSMQEASLGKVGQEILAELRKHDVLAGAATVDNAHRIASRCAEGVAGGRLTMEDILHTIRECAENERDKVAVGQGRPPGHLATFVRTQVDKAQPGCAKRRAGGWGGGGGAPQRSYEPQSGGTVGDTWEW